MSTVYLGLGSNIGNPQDNIDTAIKHISQFAEVVQISSMYTTEPVGYADQDWFVNCCIELNTDISAEKLFSHLQRIEQGMGRVKKILNGPRIIDIDVLLWNDQTIQTDQLVVPHPRMHERAFVLEPLSEIAPNLVHPTLKKSMTQLFDELEDRHQIKKVENKKEP